ncbi:YicC family protein [Rubellimicrobium rubrum]|uniref:YicC family protein n=2 Tax=Rubellimicrobium rubrum TaxID=2585369 RepID=A0A5C4MYF0_9RHOB|nr:YicC family protein [Rubellimicrobium rubrum]
MIRSMTAFASRRGRHGDIDWDWDLRSVNGRGLELRLRLPEGIAGLEQAVRNALSARLARGNVSLTLRQTRAAAEGALALDDDQLDRVLHALEHVQQRAFTLGVTLAQPTAADVLSQKGVVVAAPSVVSEEGLVEWLLTDLGVLLDEFINAREAEGSALAAVIQGQLSQIESLVEEATGAADLRRDEARLAMAAAFRRVSDEVSEIDETRLTQELALLALKSDVTEELDRLRAHVAAARELIGDPQPAGRRLDFLAQEFNREANTLMSKSGSMRLGRVGLDLKAAIDQMREQVQNVE